MEVASNQGNTSLPSAAPASGAVDAGPMKLHFELTLPRELGGELTAWRRTFERFTDVMERWLESSLAHPGLPAPPPMPWMTPAARAVPQPAPLPSPPPAPSFEIPVPPTPRTVETPVQPPTRTDETPIPLLPPLSPSGGLAPWVAETLRGSERAREASSPEPRSLLPAMNAVKWKANEFRQGLDPFAPTFS
ncbi:MAG TPA: hypothetical protein VMG10_19940 [Gemmataceae bacterium]|nr:hypothetical protein [Gemmataceae bacterium]